MLGPGGVGGLVAAQLARRGHRVICVAGEATAAALGSDGITLHSGQFGDCTVAVEAVTELREPVDVCVVATKETGLADALRRVPADRLGSGLVVPLLNGFEHVGVLRAHYPAEQVVAATIRVESTRTAPGVIEHSSPFAQIALASASAPAERVAALAALFEDAGLGGPVKDDEAAMLWQKLSFLLPMALLTTRYAEPVGAVRSGHRDAMLAVVGELSEVAAGSGIRIDAEKVLKLIDSAPAELRSSMQRDAEAGRPLEVDAIGGAVLREAARNGTAAPVITELVDAVRALSV